MDAWRLTSPLASVGEWASGMWTAAGGETARHYWAHGVGWFRPIGGDMGSVMSRISLVWLWSGVMFALALALLLTWGRSGKAGVHREDVHVQAG